MFRVNGTMKRGGRRRVRREKASRPREKPREVRELTDEMANSYRN